MSFSIECGKATSQAYIILTKIQSLLPGPVVEPVTFSQYEWCWSNQLLNTNYYAASMPTALLINISLDMSDFFRCLSSTLKQIDWFFYSLVLSLKCPCMLCVPKIIFFPIIISNSLTFCLIHLFSCQATSGDFMQLAKE